MYPRIPREKVADPLGSEQHTLAATGLECSWWAIVKILKIIREFSLLSNKYNFPLRANSLTLPTKPIQPTLHKREEIAVGGDKGFAR